MRNVLSFHKELPPWLKTYEEIVAMDINSALTELNTDATWYREKFANEWYITEDSDVDLPWRYYSITSSNWNQKLIIKMTWENSWMTFSL